MNRIPSEFDREELDWLAFRYVAGELTEIEAAQFEERLGTHQAAREAVARNVELSSILSRTLSETPKPVVPTVERGTSRLWSNISVRGTQRSSRWVLLATTAMLAILASGILWRGSDRTEVAATDESLTNAEQLVALWSESDSPAADVERMQVPRTDRIDIEHPAAEDRREKLVADLATEDALPELFPGLEGDRPGDSAAVPDWMLAGVSLEMAAELQVPAKGVR